MENGASQAHAPKLAEQVRNAEDVLSAGMSKAAQDSNKAKEVQFKALHALLIGFLFLIAFLHLIGIYLFTSGFLLSRLVLPNHSKCSEPPIELYGSMQPGSISQGCWHPKTFEKAVIIVIDALRYDFTVPFIPTADQPKPQHFHDAFPFLYETSVAEPSKAFLRPFIADPPTTTLQRLKGLTVGTLPTFIEGGSNFAGFAIDEDNLISQLVSAGKKIVHLGDDTWHSLFEGHFDVNLTRAYDSFNVKDLHTVDNGVTEHLIPLLHPSNTSKWDVVIGHYLGVDHAGHVFGPGHPAMTAKLQQMDTVLRDVASKIDDKTLLVVLGDHGMDSKGDHGGESDDEVEASLWMYSPRKAFGRTSTEFTKPPATAKERRLAQIDLVPTLALLLGLPIPFNNLGAPMEEAFVGANGNDYQNLATAHRLTGAQIRNYQEEYSKLRRLDSNSFALPWILWDAATRSWEKRTSSKVTVEQWKALASEFSTYQQHNLNVFRDLWARFDLVNMGLGIAVIFTTLAVVVVYGCSLRGDLNSLNSSLMAYGTFGFAAGLAAGSGLSLLIPSLGFMRTSAFAAAISCNVALLCSIYSVRERLGSMVPKSLWSWLCVLTVLMLSVGFAANSFTVWEDEILLFFLALFGTLMFAQTFRLQGAGRSGYYHSIMFMVMVRLASVSRLCRDEQFPFCKTTYYASSTSSTVAAWQLGISYLIALVLPSAIKSYYTSTHSYHGSAPVWIGIAFRITLLLIAIYWTLQAAEDGDWLNVDKEKLKMVRQYLAQFILYVAVGAGTATFGWQPPMIDIDTVIQPNAAQTQTQQARKPRSNGTATQATASLPSEQPQPKQQLLLRGTTNLYGSHFIILPLTVILLPLLLFQKPMGQAALACTAIAILSLLELLHLLFRHPQRSTTNSASASPPSPTAATGAASLGATILALLAHLTFFKTGHQAALASIQWDAAFIPIATVRYPWTPIFIIFNTFAGQILCAAAVPAVVLWRRPYVFVREAKGKSRLFPQLDVEGPSTEAGVGKEKVDRAAAERSKVLSDVARAVVIHVLVYAVINGATTLWAAHLRRHLMVYRVFSPRWMLGCVGLVVAEMVGVFIGVGGVRWTVGCLSGMFGY